MFRGIGKHLIPWVNNSWAPPFRIHIYPTDICNLRCNSCWRWNVSSDGHVDSRGYELSREKIMSIIDEAAELGVQTWEIAGGGEPFARKDVTLAMVERIKELGMRGIINTNATLFTPEIVRLLILSGWDNLIISLDGPDSETNDYLRPPDSFRRIMETLEMFKEYKARYKKNNPVINIHSVLCKTNFTKIIKMVDLAVRYNVPSLNFEPVKKFSSKCENLLLTRKEDFDEIKLLAKEGGELAQKNNVTTNLCSFINNAEILEEANHLTGFLKSFSEKADTHAESKLLSVCCLEPWYRLVITCEGNIAPCCLGPFFNDNLKEKSLKEIWLGESLSNFRKKILTRDLPVTCNKCNASIFTHSKYIQGLLRQGLKEHKEKPKCSVSLKMPGDNLINICLVSREYPPETDWGGIGRYTHHLAQGLANKGHQVHVIAQSLDIDKEQMDGKVHVHRVAHKTIFPFKGPFKEFILRLEYGQSVNKRLKEIIEKYKIDIIEVPNFSAEGFVHSLFKKIPLVSRLHTHFSEVIQFCQWPKTLDRKLSCLLEDYTILRSDLVTCSTHRHKDIVFDEVGANSKNIEIIPLGIPLPVLTESHFKANNPATILFVGRLERRKGAHILFKSIPYILKEFPDTKFLIIGRDTYVNEDFVSFDGKKEDSFKDKLIKSIPGKCLKNINFLDHVDNKELSRYYSCCDIFVAPSLYESFGFIYIEAMSHAKPVVGCGVGGVPEVVKDGEAGILVPPGDHISLGRAVIRLLKDTEYRLDMGAKARLHVEKNFTRDLMIERTLAAYKKALKRE